jgi:hypothetical protein
VSVRIWVRQDRGVPSVPYRADQFAALRSVISTPVRIAILETMDAATRFETRHLESTKLHSRIRQRLCYAKYAAAQQQLSPAPRSLSSTLKCSGRCVDGFARSTGDGRQ